MAEPLINMYNVQFFDRFAKAFKRVIDFDEQKFVSQVMVDEWDNRELKSWDENGTQLLWHFDELRHGNALMAYKIK
jgi:hypothetical protein